MSNSKPNIAKPDRTNANRKPVIVIGSGGHAKVLIDTLQTLGHSILFCTDVDASRHGDEVLGVSVAGHDDLIDAQSPTDVVLVNGLGSIGVPNLRKKIHGLWTDKGFDFLTVVHPTAFVSTTAKLQPGTQVMAGAIVQTAAHVASNSIINTGASVDHDCSIGAHCHIAPGVTISGSVETGELCHVGTGANIIQSIKIGNRVIVGSGATVINNIPDDLTVVGTPARSR